MKKINDVEADDVDVEVPKFQVNKDTAPLVVSVIPSVAVSSTTTINRGSMFGFEKNLSPASILEILANTRTTPFSRDDFRSFLRKRLIEENLDFCINILAFEDKFKNNVDTSKIDKEAGVVLRVLNEPSNASLNNNDLLMKVASEIVKEFVAPGSSKEINVSDDQRKDVLSVVKSWENGSVEPSPKVFDAVFNEIKTIIQTNAYNEFVNIASSMNLSVKESYIRLYKGLAYIFMVIVVMVVVIGLEFAGYIHSHWWRVISFLPLFEAFQNIESYRTRVCLVCAYLNVTGSYQEDLSVKEAKKAKVLKTITDLFARQKIISIGKKIVLFSFMEAVLFVGVIVAIPPYTNI